MTAAQDKNGNYEDNYTEANFWHKLKHYATTAGREVVEKSLLLHYAAQRSDTPGWARATVYGALGYFIAPLDAIVDVTPAVGYADDLGVLALALATITRFIDDDVRARTAARMNSWFGGDSGDSGT